MLNIGTTKPNNDNPTASVVAVQAKDIAISNISESGGAADPSKNAVVVNMNGGALTSLKAVAGASNIYGGIEINVNGGLIQDSSSGVGAVIGSSNLATNARVWGDVSINVGNSDGDPQPTVTGSILGFGMGYSLRQYKHRCKRGDNFHVIVFFQRHIRGCKLERRHRGGYKSHR